MTEHSQRTLAICGTILVVGLVFSVVLSKSLTKFNENFLAKDFYDRNPISTDAYQTLRLNDRQFIVISNGTYSRGVIVYQVDANGKVTRTSDTK